MAIPNFEKLVNGDFKTLARCISLVENQVPEMWSAMEQLPQITAPVIGITGPPGAGKSTLVDCLIGEYVGQNLSVGVLCVDPSSPFNLGALLGDRIRMSNWYTHPKVFIRSLATRGSLGGLHPTILEITDLMRAAGFDRIIVETVGVGQSEIEIAGLADCTVVVLVPEGGDEIQTMKAGLMEIADVFVVNKADRPLADQFVKNLRFMLAPTFNKYGHNLAIVKTIASQRTGIDTLASAIDAFYNQGEPNEQRLWLLAERAWQIISGKRMEPLTKVQLKADINLVPPQQFNLYKFIKNYIET